MKNHRKSLENFPFKNFKFKNLLSHFPHHKNKVTMVGNNLNSENERIINRSFVELGNEEGNASVLHSMTKKVWGGNFSSPIKNKLIKGARVLNVCCGPGYWSLDMAKSYPHSTFIGMDVPSSQFFEKEKLSNVAFLECNVHNGLPWPDNTFDFIYQRYAWASYNEDQWKYILSEIVRVCKPGGTIELMEFDWEFQNAGPCAIEYQKLLSSFFFTNGMNPAISSKIPSFLKQTGELTEIRIESRDLPLGNTNGLEGMLYLNDHFSSVSKFRNYVSRNVMLSEEEYISKVDEFTKEFESYKTYAISRRFMAIKSI